MLASARIKNLTLLHNISAHVRACLLDPCARRGIMGLTPPGTSHAMPCPSASAMAELEAEDPSGASQDVEDQDTSTRGLRTDGEVDKRTEIAHNEPNRAKNVDADIGEGATFEIGIEDSKDLLSLNEELSSILDPKVYMTINHTRLYYWGRGLYELHNLHHECRTLFARHLPVLTSLPWSATPSNGRRWMHLRPFMTKTSLRSMKMAPASSFK
jgi:hypothetical protein